MRKASYRSLSPPCRQHSPTTLKFLPKTCHGWASNDAAASALPSIPMPKPRADSWLQGFVLCQKKKQGMSAGRRVQSTPGWHVPRESARIPTLEDVLALMSSSSLTLRLEIKRAADGSAYPGIIEQAVERIKVHDLDGQYYVTAFHTDDLRTLSKVAADAASLLLMEEQTFHAIGGVDGLVRVLELAGTHQATLPIGCLTPQLLQQAARQNVSISAFGCHSRLQIEKALHLALGVFTTDRPSLAIALRHTFQSA